MNSNFRILLPLGAKSGQCFAHSRRRRLDFPDPGHSEVHRSQHGRRAVSYVLSKQGLGGGDKPGLSPMKITAWTRALPLRQTPIVIY